MKNKAFTWLLAIVFVSSFSGCGSENNGNGTPGSDTLNPVPGDWVRVLLPSKPDNLNPLTHSHATATYIMEFMYYTLLYVDPVSLEFKPQLALSMPEISADGRSITWEIIPEATWDNGSPVTGHDYAFSLKAMRNPLTNCGTRRNYYNFIEDVVIDPANPKKFTVKTAYPFFLAKYSTGGMDILPKHVYDPNGYMDGFTLPQLASDGEALMKDSSIVRFARDFNSPAYSSDPANLQGCGPYKLENFSNESEFHVVRKKDWFGDKATHNKQAFEAWPEKIIYKVIKDKTAAVNALKNGEVDAMSSITESEFVEMQKGGYVKEHYNLYTPEFQGFSYLALNTRPPGSRAPLFEDKRVRRAFAHLIDYDLIYREIYLGFAKRLNGPVLPSAKEYNHNLPLINFDPAQAAKLLDEAGWKDSNGNGIRDKNVNGKVVEFEAEFLIANSSNTGERQGQIIADACMKAGLKINIKSQDFKLCTEAAYKHDYDLIGLTNANSPLPTDLQQVWHTEQWTNHASNITGFGNQKSDELILAIRNEMDDEKRLPLYMEIQQMIYDETPAIFMRVPVERIAVHKRFRNANPTVVRPGFKPNLFWVPAAQQMFRADSAAVK